MNYVERTKKWIKPDKTDINWGTTVVWSVLFVVLWAVAIIQIYELNIPISSEIFLILTGGIGSYFIGKATSDTKKDHNRYYNKTVRTTFGIRPKLARTLLAISLAVIYLYLLANEIFTTPILTIFIDQTKYELISNLFWAVIGFYLPTFHALLFGQKELPRDIEKKIIEFKEDIHEPEKIREKLSEENINVPAKMIAQYLE